MGTKRCGVMVMVGMDAHVMVGPPLTCGGGGGLNGVRRRGS